MDQSIAKAITDISEKYRVSSDIVKAMIQFDCADQIPADSIKEINERKMEAVLKIVNECEMFTIYGNGKPAGSFLPDDPKEAWNNHHHCNYVLIFKEPIIRMEKQHLSNCLMACTNRKGTSYYSIKAMDKDNKTGIYYLDTVCGCSKGKCSFPNFFDISCISSISEEAFQKRLLSGMVHNPEEVYALIRDDITPKLVKTVYAFMDKSLKEDHPAESGRPEDLRYIG